MTHVPYSKLNLPALKSAGTPKYFNKRLTKLFFLFVLGCDLTEKPSQFPLDKLKFIAVEKWWWTIKSELMKWMWLATVPTILTRMYHIYCQLDVENKWAYKLNERLLRPTEQIYFNSHTKMMLFCPPAIFFFFGFHPNQKRYFRHKSFFFCKVSDFISFCSFSLYLYFNLVGLFRLKT